MYKKTYTTKFHIQIRESYHLSQQEKKVSNRNDITDKNNG